MPESFMKKTSILQLSGESGGGQLLRSALSLSLVTGQPFRMTDIRGKRPKPGLMRQHLTCVKAALEVSDGAADGAEIGSTELVFRPGLVKAGDYAFAIGSGGSTTLVLQTLLPALLHAEAVSKLRIEGGTHNPMAPPFEFIEQCFLPVLKRMGGTAKVTLERHGFMQAGGGVMTAEIQPVKKWKKLKLTERKEEEETFGLVLHAHLAADIARREIGAATKILGWEADALQLRYANESIGPGNAILLGVRHGGVCNLTSGVAQMGKSAESVAVSAAKSLRSFLASPAPVGAHLADQLLLPLALAGGGQFVAQALTNHCRTSMDLISKFIPDAAFKVTELDGGGFEIRL